MISKIVKYHVFPVLNSVMKMRFNTRKDFEERLAKKQFHQILGISNSSHTANKMTQKDLHRAYLSQIKKFHSDNAPNDTNKKDLEEITKCIITAYEELKKRQVTSKQQSSQEDEILKEEEQISQALFGKKYKDVKHSLYASGNQHLRMQFLNELRKKKNIPNDDKYHEDKGQQSQQKSNVSSGQQQLHKSFENENSQSKLLKILFVCCCLGLLPFVAFTQHKKLQHKPEHQVKQYTKEQLKVMQANTHSLNSKSFQIFYESLYKRRPPMLSYPHDSEPHILEQLTKYSIAPDIHLYEVPSKYFLDHKQFAKLEQGNTIESLPRYQLTQTKPNTLLTLSLQAQRVLQNVYIKVDDILKQIKETGKYIPPKVLFKYHGYLMVDLREKPFSHLNSYRNTKYISLFDLYFDLYSPIFFKRDHFTQYLVGLDQDVPKKNTRYFGNVHINHRSIPLRYIGKDQKVVIMTDVKKAYEPSGRMKEKDQKYQFVWENYYARFEKEWKKYAQHQINHRS